MHDLETIKVRNGQGPRHPDTLYEKARAHAYTLGALAAREGRWSGSNPYAQVSLRSVGVCFDLAARWDAGHKAYLRVLRGEAVIR